MVVFCICDLGYLKICDLKKEVKMSLLQNIVTQALKNSLGDTQKSNQAQQNQSTQGGLGDLLGGLLGNQQGSQSSSLSGLGDLLGSLAGSKATGNQLGGLLGQVLGGQTRNSPADLGSILGQVLGGQSRGGGFNKQALLLALLPVVLSTIQKNGGLSGILTKLQSLGLANKASSWVSSGSNSPLDNDEVERLFDKDDIEQVCQKTGANCGEVYQGLADLLPSVVSELTPKGNLDTEGEANNEISDILANFVKAR